MGLLDSSRPSYRRALRPRPRPQALDLAGHRNRGLRLARIRRPSSRGRASPVHHPLRRAQAHLWYRVVCYTAAWIDLLVPFTINLIGLIVAFFTGRWVINDLYVRLYYVLAAAIPTGHHSRLHPSRAPAPPAMKARKKAGFTWLSGLLSPRSLPAGPCGGWENILSFLPPASATFASRLFSSSLARSFALALLGKLPAPSGITSLKA